MLHLRACREDGRPLPKWCQFDEQQRAFVGTGPMNIDEQEWRIAVIASDVDGMEARSSFVIRRVITVQTS